MIELTVQEVVQITGGRIFLGGEDAPVTGFSIDSRTIKPGEFFIAVRGDSFDGHDFAGEALAKGAAGLILENTRPSAGVGKDAQVILVEDTLKAMASIAAGIRNRVDIPVVAVTGSNGKTTVKEMLAFLLARKYKVLKSVKSYNNVIGLSLTMFDLDATYDMVVVELGTNQPGEIAELAKIVRPTTAVITNIGNAHLEFFLDKKGVFKEKTSLLDFLPDDATAFLNKDDRLLAEAITAKGGIMTYGMTDGCDFRITDVEKKENGYSFLLNGKKFFIPLEGEHNVYNAAVALAVAGNFGLDYAALAERVKKIVLPQMRLERVEIEGVTFINDSYNANPDSFECALKVLTKAAGGKKGVIAGDMLELGEASDDLHRMVGKSIASKGVDFLIGMGEKGRIIVSGALESGMEKNRALYVESYEDAALKLKEIAEAETVVLLKGSRALRMEEVLKCFTTYCTL